MLVNICMEFHEDILNSFQVTEWTCFCDRQTDGWMNRQTTRAKTICLPTLKGGDIKKINKKMMWCRCFFTYLISRVSFVYTLE